MTARRSARVQNLATPAVVAAYAALGLVLVATRLIGLDRGYWHDEIVTMRDVVMAGPKEIFAGERLNHQLFSVLAWATISVGGESEYLTRLWSVVPFVVGAVVVTGWLHVRVGAPSGILFLFMRRARPCSSTSPDRHAATG